MNYTEFLKSKEIVDKSAGIDIDPDKLNPMMRDDQRIVTAWMLRRGRGGDYKDTGMGKSFDLLEWSRVISEIKNAKVLIFSPLAVAQQTHREGLKFGIQSTVCKSQDDVRPGINIANYERQHRFKKSEFIGIGGDEASAIKNHDSATLKQLLDFSHGIPFRLALSATPSPNSWTELGCQSEFLGIMSMSEMKATFFEHDGKDTSQYHLKPWGEKAFWKWLASWCVYIRKPSDIGCSDDGFNLPPLHYHNHFVHDDCEPLEGSFIAMAAETLAEQREIKRKTLRERCEAAAERVNASTKPVIVWCELNDEGEMLSEMIKDGMEVAGRHTLEEKEDRLNAFVEQKERVLITKPSICSQGLNLQFCAEQHFVNVTHSHEQAYQCVRRSYRFLQQNPVHIHRYLTEREMPILQNVERKAKEADEMASNLVRYMADSMKSNLGRAKKETEEYSPTQIMEIPSWM